MSTTPKIHRDDLPDPDDPRALIARHLGTEQANTFLSWLEKNGWTVTRKGEPSAPPRDGVFAVDWPNLPSSECCASGRCEVCTPGFEWGRDG